MASRWGRCIYRSAASCWLKRQKIEKWTSLTIYKGYNNVRVPHFRLPTGTTVSKVDLYSAIEVYSSPGLGTVVCSLLVQTHSPSESTSKCRKLKTMDVHGDGGAHGVLYTWSEIHFLITSEITLSVKTLNVVSTEICTYFICLDNKSIALKSCNTVNTGRWCYRCPHCFLSLVSQP